MQRAKGSRRRKCRDTCQNAHRLCQTSMGSNFCCKLGEKEGGFAATVPIIQFPRNPVFFCSIFFFSGGSVRFFLTKMLRIAARRLSSLSSSHFRPTIASSLPGSHKIIDGGDSAPSNDSRSVTSFNTFPFGPIFDRNCRGWSLFVSRFWF